MKVLPLDKNDLERCVTNFHSYSNEIRMNIPDLLLATMELMFTKFKSIKDEKSNTASGDFPSADLVSHAFFLYSSTDGLKFMLICLF
jgi:hypothetical protein